MEKAAIKPLNAEAAQQAAEYIDNLLKPIGALGKLEAYAAQLAGIRGKLDFSPLKKTAVLVFAADNGVHDEGITPVPQIVTLTQTINIADGLAGVSVFAKKRGTDVFVYNVGVKPEFTHEKVINACVKHGTDNFAKGSAMTRAECEAAFKVGFDAAFSRNDYDALGVGEMGICNTASTTAVLSALLDISPEEITGRGAGIDDAALSKKIACIKTAIALNKPDKNDVLDVIAKVGGLDIAAMTGAFTGAAAAGVPVVIDGYISVCAALCAYLLDSGAKDYMFASHKSFEAGYMRAVSAIGLSPAFDLEMRLGEGSGCPIMFDILDYALCMAQNMATFEQGNVDSSEYVDIR